MIGLPRSPQVVMLVGGRGERLGALTAQTQKCLLPAAGRPFLEYLIELFAGQGVTEFLACSGHLAEQVVRTVGDGSRWGVKIRHSVEPRPLGTIGALRHAAPLLDDVFVLSYGDVYHRIRLSRLLGCWYSADRPALMSVVPDRSGNVDVLDGLVGRYDKDARPGSCGWLDAGLLVLRRQVLRDEATESQLYGRLSTDRQLSALCASAAERPYDIGSVTGYRAFCAAAGGRRL